ncbi:MAG: VTT domain-containing protein [Pirellulales bacterium]|nr:VTT domain-containing protein [Pirellulales bacterium]
MDELLHQYGYFGIIFFLVLTGFGLPIPEEVALIAAGIMAAKGYLDIWLAMGACLIGCLLGDSIMYLIGYRLGGRMLRPGSFWRNYLTPEREKSLEHLIHRHGVKVFFVSRFLVGVRSPVYLTAGILRYPYRKFFITDLFCASLVILLFTGLSYFFGEWAVRMVQQAEYGLTILVGVGLVGATIFGWYYVYHRRGPHDPGALGKLLGEDQQSMEEGLQDEEQSATSQPTSTGTSPEEINNSQSPSLTEPVAESAATATPRIQSPVAAIPPQPTDAALETSPPPEKPNRAVGTDLDAGPNPVPRQNGSVNPQTSPSTGLHPRQNGNFAGGNGSDYSRKLGKATDSLDGTQLTALSKKRI